MILSKLINNNKYLQHSESIVHVDYTLSPHTKKLILYFFFPGSNDNGGKEFCFYIQRRSRFCYETVILNRNC